MKITIIGGGNMGGAIAQGLAEGSHFKPQNITVINKSQIRSYGNGVRAVVADYSSLADADIVVLAVKPWHIQAVLEEHGSKLSKPNQLLLSVASGITLSELKLWAGACKALFRVMPNTAIAQKQSMTFITSTNASSEQNEIILNIFNELGKAEMIDESLFSAATALSVCGIAFAFRYIRASMEGAIEMGLPAKQSLSTVLQTLRGAVELLEANQTHPEQEIDKVTTPGGITIKGLNEMEHAGFTSAVIRGLKASSQR